MTPNNSGSPPLAEPPHGPAGQQARRRALRPAHRGRALRPVGLVWMTAGFVMVVAVITMLALQFVKPGGDHGMPGPTATVTADAHHPQPSVNAGDRTRPVVAPDALASTADPNPPAVVVEEWIDLSQHSIDDPASPWVVVNKIRPIEPQSWEPAELDPVDEAQLAPRAAAALQTLFDAAAAEGLQLRTGTGFRSYDYQRFIYEDYVAEFGQDQADRFSARPGYSEHQTGWAVDIYSSEQCRIQECFGDEPAGLWVADHAHEYGFITRYPRGEEDVTGYRYEPWHLRYVGPELAAAMQAHRIVTLEQAFDLPAAPDY